MLKFDEKTKKMKGTIKGLDGKKISIDTEIRENQLTEDNFKALQIQIYTMLEGGILADFATTQPADFYIDARCGKYAFPQSKIYAAVELLKAFAILMGKDPKKLPRVDVPYAGWTL